MRKTFKLFCAAAVALLAVSSCGKIWDEFDNVYGEIDALENRLDSLENALNGQVSTINTTLGTLAAADKKLADDIAAVVADVKKTNDLVSALDAYDKTLDGKIEDLEAALAAFEDQATKDLAAAVAKIAVVKVEKNKAGNYVLTFADGNTLEVAADANANNTGVITTVDVDGVTYWAVIGADGKATVLDAAVHPDTKLQFKVDPKTHELYVAYDGKTWEKTGVIVNDDTTINVVTNFVDAEDYVTVTVAGKEYKLPKYVADNSELVLGRDEVYFVYGATKNVTLSTADVQEYYVMAKPDGWKASIEKGKIVVTAPAKSLIEMGAAESEGEVLVHATTMTGACKVVKLNVTVGESLVLTYNDGIVTLMNANLDAWEGEMGEVAYDWSDIVYGLISVSEYAEYESFEAYMATEPEYLSSLQIILFNNLDVQEEYAYKEGVYEEFVSSMSLVDIVKNSWSDFELDEKETYLMWAAPRDLYDEAVYVFTGSYVDVEETASLFNNVVMSAKLYGADAYVVGSVAKSKFDEWGIDETYTYEDALEDYLTDGWGGPLTDFNDGNKSALGDMFTENGTFTINLDEVVLSERFFPGMDASLVSPDSEYYVWVLPYYNSKKEYSAEDLVITTVKSAPMVYNADIKATVTVEEVTFESAVISIVVPEGGSTSFELMTAEDFEYFMNDGAVDVDMLIEYLSGNPSITEEYYEGEDAWIEEYGDWFIDPNTSYVFVTYNKVDGEHSVGFSTTFTTPEDPASAVPSPDKKQWVTDNEAYMEMFGSRILLDFGISSKYYSDYGFAANTMFLAQSYEDIYGPDAAGVWVTPMFFGTYTIEPTDETSGVITYNGAEIPYSNLTATTCTFDFTDILEIGEVEFTLVEEEVTVQAQ